MRKRSKSLVASAIASFLAAFGPLSTVRAECAVGADDVARCVGKVQEIWVHNDFVRLNMVANEGLLAEKCWARDNMWLEIPSGDPSLQAYLSLLLAAKLSGSELLVRLTPGPADATTGQRPCRVFYIIAK